MTGMPTIPEQASGASTSPNPNTCGNLVQSGSVIKHEPHVVNSKSASFPSGAQSSYDCEPKTANKRSLLQHIISSCFAANKTQRLLAY